jgi:hypothetical protein
MSSQTLRKYRHAYCVPDLERLPHGHEVVILARHQVSRINREKQARKKNSHKLLYISDRNGKSNGILRYIPASFAVRRV